jgi:DnaJ-class molecular chaperone
MIIGHQKITCFICDGDGDFDDGPCPSCEGIGYVDEQFEGQTNACEYCKFESEAIANGECIRGEDHKYKKCGVPILDDIPPPVGPKKNKPW